MITIDGSFGEGGGQILRTSLALSLVTGKPFSIEKIRAGRAKPGLLRQHLTAVRAAGEIGRARIEGAELGSGQLTFVPDAVRPGAYDFAVGTAGSATLVLQTMLPALMLAGGPSQLRLEGGTHNTYAPPLDFLEKAFLPILRRMGPEVAVTLERFGFYPAGGGRSGPRGPALPQGRRAGGRAPGRSASDSDGPGRRLFSHVAPDGPHENEPRNAPAFSRRPGQERIDRSGGVADRTRGSVIRIRQENRATDATRMKHG